jgi:hypothetical protein
MHLTMFWPMAAIWGMAAIGSAAMAQHVFVQNQAQFRAALENTSTSPSFILITVIDGRSGARRTGCTTAGFLLHAIANEDGIDRADYHGIMLSDVAKRVKAKALVSKDHVYILQRPEALAAVPMEGKGFDLACEIIRAGSPAYMEDRTGQISAGWPLGMEPKP